MARAKPGLERAVNEILLRHGSGGRRLSYRQAERLTGLSPATIGELAKGNARTPETVRRFAVGMGEDLERLMLFAGFVPETHAQPHAAEEHSAMSAPLHRTLEALECALARLPEGPERNVWLQTLEQLTRLIEMALEKDGISAPPHDPDSVGHNTF